MCNKKYSMGLKENVILTATKCVRINRKYKILIATKCLTKVFGHVTINR